MTGRRSMDAEDRAAIEAERGYREAGEREVRLREWAALRGDAREPAPNPKAFKRLVWALQAKKYWAAKNPEAKARTLAYRAQWYQLNKARARENQRKWRKAHPRSRDKEREARRDRRRAASFARRATLIYTCAGCGSMWSPATTQRIPTRPPKWCSLRCRNEAYYAKRRCKLCGRTRGEHDLGDRCQYAWDRPRNMKGGT